MERHTSDVASMTLECKHRGGIGRFDIVELDRVMARSR